MTIYMTGNTHFDPVWLWRWDEAMASIRSTLRSALDRMNEDPDFKYAFSAPAVFRFIEEVDPDLFAEIRQRVKEGRWELGEGWYLQADAYTGSGESYVRQGLYGQRWLHDRFGAISTTCYGIDSFGHPHCLPGLLQGMGIQNVVFCRPEEHMMELPAPLFRWEGQDGQSVLAYRVGGEDCGAYSPKLETAFPELLKHLPDHNCDRLVVFGVTDHGGAPTKKDLATIRRFMAEAEKDGSYEIRFSSVEEYFADQRSKVLPTVNEELKVTYIGPSVNETWLKQNERRTERMLKDAETAALLERLLIGTPVPKAKLQSAWEDLLFNQFHDILGGCCIPDAYTDARDLFGHAVAEAGTQLHKSLQRITRRIQMPGKNPDNAWNLCVWNLSGTAGEQEIVADAQWAWEFPWYEGGITLVTPEGEEISAQLLRSDAVIPGFRSRYVFRATLPAYGWRTFVVKPNDQRVAYVESQDTRPTVIRDGNLILTVGPNGGLSSVQDASGRLLAENLFVPFVQKDICDTWGFNKTVYEEEHLPLTLQSCRLVEDGNVRTTWKQTLSFGRSTVEEYITLHRNTGKLTCRVRALWAEERCALRLSLTAHKADTCCAASPAGWAIRPGEEFEKPFCGWLSLYGKESGITVATDELFAYQFNGKEVALSVLRNVIRGDLREKPLDETGDYSYMGQGETVAACTVSFHTGAFDPAQAERLYAITTRRPTVIMEANHSGSLPSDMEIASVTGNGIVPMAFKAAEDTDEAVFRFRDCRGEQAAGELRILDHTHALCGKPFSINTLCIKENASRSTDLLEDTCPTA